MPNWIVMAYSPLISQRLIAMGTVALLISAHLGLILVCCGALRITLIFWNSTLSRSRFDQPAVRSRLVLGVIALALVLINASALAELRRLGLLNRRRREIAWTQGIQHHVRCTQGIVTGMIRHWRRDGDECHRGGGRKS